MRDHPTASPPWRLSTTQQPKVDYVYAPKVVSTNDPLYAHAASLGAPDLPLRMVVRDNWLSLAVYAAPGATRYCLLMNDEHGWTVVEPGE